MRRLLILLLAVTLLVLGLDRLLQRESGRVGESAREAPLPSYVVEAELEAGGMKPYRLRVPKDHRVSILIHAAPKAGAGLLTLSGYQDRLEPVGIGPGLSREIVFVSDRPGDDFGFLLGGDLVGRLEVTGSHLKRGHE